LILAWGAFRWIQVVSGRQAWHLLPVPAMLAYGWVFHAGFGNFYLSLGLLLLGAGLGLYGSPSGGSASDFCAGVAGPLSAGAMGALRAGFCFPGATHAGGKRAGFWPAG